MSSATAQASSPAYSPQEELAHTLTAGLGIVACAIAIPWLAWAAAGDALRLAGAMVFGTTALAMFTTSVIYHWERQPARKIQLRKLDHSAIYLLIAGTYTPFTLVAMQGAWAWSLFGVVWTLAVLGIVAKTTVGFRYPRLSTILYLGMGWLIIVAIKPLRENLTAAQIGWIAAGGLLYTGGVPFYIWKTKRYTHAVWHLFVLGGVACHFVAVLSLVSGRH
ncbi:MAG TPA: hemolysin III family protein [Steroidobacteraceae bacterium]|nr:hemolysin III family protein [Steroidobacteraceae bacterium]